MAGTVIDRMQCVPFYSFCENIEKKKGSHRIHNMETQQCFVIMQVKIP